jgi:hypothetical protein
MVTAGNLNVQNPWPYDGLLVERNEQVPGLKRTGSLIATITDSPLD